MSGRKSHVVGLLLLTVQAVSASVLIKGGTVVDGSGRPGFLADVRLSGTNIVAVGRLRARKGETVVDAKGKVVTPGFIDAHSHADSALDKLESQVRQGITTAVVGQDGSHRFPLSNYFESLRTSPLEINFATFCGHGTVRSAVMGTDFRRRATSDEVKKMQALIDQEMRAGALGLSSGLEYDPGHYSDTDELVQLAKAAARYGGMYISHVRDEGPGALDSFRELIRIAREARLPAQISHIKVAVASVWGKGDAVLKLMADARQSGIDVTADVYPYTYWQSTITALSVSRDWKNSAMWDRALRETGGASRVRLTTYSPDPSWQGKTLDELETSTGRSAADLIVEIVEKTRDGKGEESILCEAMSEDDVRAFVRSPLVMFCSDGSGKSSHPRGRGAFPRVLAKYVRSERLVSLAAAVRKMTSFPAMRFGLADRGLVRKGMKADLVVFDPKTVTDRATATEPGQFSVGIEVVFVNGKAVLKSGKMTGAKPGTGLKHVPGKRLPRT